MVLVRQIVEPLEVLDRHDAGGDTAIGLDDLHASVRYLEQVAGFQLLEIQVYLAFAWPHSLSQFADTDVERVAWCLEQTAQCQVRHKAVGSTCWRITFRYSSPRGPSNSSYVYLFGRGGCSSLVWGAFSTSARLLVAMRHLPLAGNV